MAAAVPIRGSNGQFAHPLPGTYQGGAVEMTWPRLGYVGDEAFTFIDRVEDAIARQVGDQPAPADSQPRAQLGERYTLIVRGETFTVTVVKVFSLTSAAKTRWRLRLSVDGAPRTLAGKLPEIVVSYEQWLALNPYRRQIVSIRNGRQGETLRELTDGRIVVQIIGTGLKMAWEIYTPEALAVFTPPKPKPYLPGCARDPIHDWDLPWPGYPE